MLNLPDFPRSDYELLVGVLCSPFFEGGVFGAPWEGEGVWAIVWHKPFVPVWRWRILIDDRVVSQGEADDPALVVSEWRRAVQGGQCYPTDFRQFPPAKAEAAK